MTHVTCDSGLQLPSVKFHTLEDRHQLSGKTAQGFQLVAFVRNFLPLRYRKTSQMSARETGLHSICPHAVLFTQTNDPGGSKSTSNSGKQLRFPCLVIIHGSHIFDCDCRRN